MQINDSIKVKGQIVWKVYSRFDKWHQRVILKILQRIGHRLDKMFLEKYGTIKDSFVIDNLVTSAGKAAIAGLVGNVGSITAFSYIAVGSSSTPPAVGQTALVSEIATAGLTRAAGSVSRITTNVANDTTSIFKSFTLSGSATVEEIGVFNASSSGIMLGRALTSTKSLTTGDVLACTYNVIFS